MVVPRGDSLCDGMQSSARTDYPVEVALCRTALAAGDRLALHVRGTSMLPALWPGEKVWVEQTNVDALRSGDVIVFVRDHQLVVHRVVGIAKSTNRAALTTRGDAQLEDDVPVEPRDVVGVVRAVRRFGADRPLSGRPSLAAGILSRLVLRSEMVRFLLAGIHSRLATRRFGLGCPRTAPGTSR
jgi:signal peptidase I